MKIKDLFAKKRLFILGASLFVVQLAARADDDAPPAVQIHGYSTLGYSQTLLETAQNRNQNSDTYGNITTPYVVDKKGTTLYNSTLGLNISYTFSDQLNFYGQLTATGTVPASGTPTAAYPVKVDMAMLNYHPTDWFSLRVGRQVSPTWMYSEQIDVGVTYPWIRPPVEVYNLAPLKAMTGVGVDLSQEFFGLLNVQAAVRYGQSPYNDDSKYVGTVKLNNILIANVEVGINNMIKLRTSYGASDAETQVPKRALINTTTGAIATYNGTVDYQTRFTFRSLGATVDWDNLQLIGEWAQTDQNVRDITSANEYKNQGSFVAAKTVPLAYSSAVFKMIGWYGTVAYHFGDFTPHFTYSNMEQNGYSFDYANFRYIPAAFRTGYASLVNPSAATNIVHTAALGTNYNFTPTIVGKFQLAQTRTFTGSNNQWAPTVSYLNSQTLTNNDIINVGEAAVSFVF